MPRGDAPVYGINTGFGALAETAIPRDALGALQLNLLRSHAAGVGEPLPVRAVRATMALRANVLAKGYSGIRRATLERLIDAAQPPRPPARAEPRIGRRERRPRAARPSRARAHRRRPSDGRRRSDGADRTRRRSRRAGLRAGDARAEGRARAHQRHAAVDRGRGAGARRRRAARARRRHRRRAVDRRAARLDPPVRCAHPRRAAATPGQRASAPTSLRCSQAAPINKSHEHCGRVQDAYSLRCAPQVHGAARDALALRAPTLDDRGQRRDRQPDGLRRRRARSSRAATFTARRSRSPPIVLAIALAQLATISERRSDRLVNPALSGLPAFLTPTAACTRAT